MLNTIQANINESMSDNFSNNNPIHSTTPQPPKNNPKIPPIILKGSAWRKVEGKLMTIIPKDSIETEAFGPDSIKLQFFDIKLFRIIQKFLQTRTQNTILSAFLMKEHLKLL